MNEQQFQSEMKRDLRSLYGGHDNRDAVNAGIRAEMVGGDDLLAALPLVDRLAQRLNERDLAGAREAQEALGQLRLLRDIMARIVLNCND